MNEFSLIYRNQVVEEIKNNEGFDGGEVDINEVLVY